jgi:hypothetical protein
MKKCSAQLALQYPIKNDPEPFTAGQSPGQDEKGQNGRYLPEQDPEAGDPAISFHHADPQD